MPLAVKLKRKWKGKEKSRKKVPCVEARQIRKSSTFSTMKSYAIVGQNIAHVSLSEQQSEHERIILQSAHLRQKLVDPILDFPFALGIPFDGSVTKLPINGAR